MPNLSDYDPAVKYGANLDVNVDLADIRDANNNELLELDTVASAVNYVRIANAATGGNPEISVQGDDTNASLALTPLGTGLALVGDTATAAYDRGSATINAQRGRLTDWQLSGGTAVSTTVIIYNNKIGASSNVLATLDTRDVTAGRPFISGITARSGSVVITVVGLGATATGTAVVNFVVLA